jgi:RNA polymerase sigma-70 factor (ECF subfamily)
VVPRTSAATSNRSEREDALRELVLRAVNGEEEALHELLKNLTPQFVYVSKMILGPTSTDIDDCVQESSLALANALPAFRGDCTVLYFAIRIAMRCARSVRRRLRLSQERMESVVQLEKALIGGAFEGGDQALLAQRSVALRSLLAELPVSQSAAFALRVVLGYSVKEVARVQGAPVNTVRSRIRLARTALRRRINEDPALAELFANFG